MNSKGTGLTLALGIVIGFIGYILWQITIGPNTKSDDITTILTNSGDGSAMIKVASILIAVGLVVHVAGLINTRGTAAGNMESIGIISITAAIAIWVTNVGVSLSIAEMGEKFVAAMAGAAAGNAEAAASAGNIGTAAGFSQAYNVATSTMGGLLAGIGWLCLGIAYRGSDAKGVISFIPLGFLAIIIGLILIIANVIITSLVSVEAAGQISGIGFILIVIWSVSRGLELSKN
ncbi:hypothetical protein OAK52_03410 [Chloroflexi bacterium]|jgi:hypothetical protein|nr:hypothetical protein [Chloroflexota bacterium]MDC0253190.1 hypothetical protein [Chloroflexota bacterium]RZP14414.1 MAG: hypothetical protein EVA32_02280 [Chloroflexota bacterium]|tara:strand:+ start:4548 stop:5246 length:699 start_codon:yes stop_codon:yes gene_type:complete